MSEAALRRRSQNDLIEDGLIVNGCVEFDDYDEALCESMGADTISMSGWERGGDMPIFAWDAEFEKYLKHRQELLARVNAAGYSWLPWDVLAHLPSQFKKSNKFAFTQGQRPSCIPGDQLVVTLDGNLPISELVKHEVIYLPSYSARAGKVVLKQGRAYKTEIKDCVRVITDKGSYLLSTEHKVMLSSGKLLEAGKLVPGNSIQHSVTKVSKGYFTINNLQVDRMTCQKGSYYAPLHGMLAHQEKYLSSGVDYLVHHIDGNKLNNDISNLEIIPRGKHSSLHIANNPNRVAAVQTQDYANKMRKLVTGSHYSFENAEQQAKAKLGQKKWTKNYVLRKGYEILNGHPVDDLNSDVYGVIAKSHFLTKCQDQYYEVNCRGKKRTWLCSASNNANKAVKAHFKSILASFGSLDAFIKELAANNDRVKKVVPIGLIECYDIEVFDVEPDDGRDLTEHNFFLCSEQSSRWKSQCICIKNCAGHAGAFAYHMSTLINLALGQAHLYNPVNPTAAWLWSKKGSYKGGQSIISQANAVNVIGNFPMSVIGENNITVPKDYMNHREEAAKHQSGICFMPLDNMVDRVIEVCKSGLALFLGNSTKVADRCASKNGMRIATLSGKWNHATAIGGYVFDGGEDYVFFLNSHGPRYKGADKYNAPLDGVWMNKAILKQFLSTAARYKHPAIIIPETPVVQWDSFEPIVKAPLVR